jgi:hypothetical protein
LTVTDVLDVTGRHPETLTETEYVPDMAVVALVIVGFCVEEVYEDGPDQLKVAPPTLEEADKFIELPEQTGVLLEVVTVGVKLTLTTVDEEAEHPFAVAVTV